MAIFEFIHCYVETLNAVFGNVCELDVALRLWSDSLDYVQS